MKGEKESENVRTDFTQIKAAIDLVRIVESYGIQLRQAGRDYVGLCPFHEDKEPSLRITPSKGLFRCPACNASGNVIQFVARKENISDREAALKLCGSIPGIKSASELLTTREKKPSFLAVDEATRATLLGRVVGFYAKTLIKDRAGLEYLKTRRLDDPAMLETFRIGYCNGTLRQALPKEGEIIEQLKSIGILNERGNEVFYKRVIIPIHDPSGNVISIYGRRLNEEEPKHLYLKGIHRGVFNSIAAKHNERLIITEALMDAMSLWSAGWHNVISLYGKDGWTAEHDNLLQEHHIQELILALDNDERGQEAASALEKKLSEKIKTIHRINWPEGIKDANAFFLSRSAKDFAALLPETVPPVEAVREENIILTEAGFNIEISGREYELCAIEKPSAARLKATIKVLSTDANRFHIDTVDFYLSRSRRIFIAEAARLLREIPETIESDVNRILLAVEKYITQRIEGKNSAIAIDMPDAERLEALRMGRSAGLIDELQRDLGKLGLIGEETNRLLLYLAMTSRKMDEPLAVQILSSSGAGKSHLQDAVLTLCPEEDLIKLTSLSGQALFYKGEESLRHKCLAIAEVAGAEGARYALRNLISDKKLVIETTIKNALTGRLETQINTVYGPTAVFETTTQPDTDPETKSRYILLSIDESPEQTRAILEAQRHSHTLEMRKRRKTRENIHLKHRAFQRLLKPMIVINPFEPLLTYGSDRLAFRRDHPKYLNLILAITFLHQLQRPCKHDPELGEYIETTLEDIAIANELAHSLFAQTLDELSFPSRDLLRLTADYVSQRATAENKQPDAVEFSRRELREAIKWSEARLRLHLGELIRMEYITSVTGRFGQRYKHRLLIAPDEINLDGRVLPELKSVEQLGKEAQTIGLIPTPALNLATLNPNLASRNGNLAGTSQARTCEVYPSVEPHIYRLNGHSMVNLASKSEAYIEKNNIL